MAFRLFHGCDGVVPLPGRSYVQSETLELGPPALQFNPLAAKAATISLSGCGAEGPFRFDAFSGNWKNPKKKPSKKEFSSQGQHGQHKVMSKEWLQTGNCPIAKPYRAVSGVKLKCPPAIVAAGPALAQTPFAKNLRTQPLPTKILAIGVLGTAANVPLGIWRQHTKKFSPASSAPVHAAVPCIAFIAILEKYVLMPKTAMAFAIGASILVRSLVQGLSDIDSRPTLPENWPLQKLLP